MPKIYSFEKKPVASQKIQDGGYFQDGWHVNIFKIHFGEEFDLRLLFESFQHKNVNIFKFGG
jgi:hypothetical protein